jgi:glycopeptide antibiotics resistance protein
LFCAIGIFELLQLIPSSRHAHIEDVFFKDAGALVGISIVYVIGKIGGGDRSKAPIQTDRMKATVERET